MTPETNFEQWLAALDDQSRTCAVHAYTAFAFDSIVGTDPDLLNTASEHGDFWNGVMAALQASTFVALGRLYEERRDSFCATRLLRFVVDNRGIFSRTRLFERKIRLGGLSRPAAEAFAADAHEPSKTELVELRDVFEQSRQVYTEKVATIRHEVFAHAGRITKNERDRLGRSLPKSDLAQLVVLPLRLHRALCKTYFDGYPLALEDPVTAIADVLAAKPSEHTSTWEHLHAAGSVADFLASMKAPR